jgi:DegV family protein with EDD domain
VIRLVTDSSADLPSDLVHRHGIEVVPLTIRFGSEEYVDGVDLTPHEFWNHLQTSSSLPETAAPSAGAFKDAYARLAEQGADGIVVITLSSDISATYQAAVIGAEGAPVPVKVIDSRTTTVELALQILAGVKAAEAGGDLEAVIRTVEHARDHTKIIAALDTLEFLKRGGRIGGAAAFLGGLLDLKPMITFENGVVAAAGRVRTRSKALTALIDRVARVADSVEALAVVHGSAPDVDSIVERLGEVVPHIDPLVAELGAVVGTHSGPGTIGVAYLTH